MKMSTKIGLSIEQINRRVEAKSRLTDLQWRGGPELTPADIVKINDVLELIFGDYKFELPPGPTTQWGFVAWANWITGGQW